MANKSSSNHDRNQMYMKDREREEDDRTGRGLR